MQSAMLSIFQSKKTFLKISVCDRLSHPRSYFPDDIFTEAIHTRFFSLYVYISKTVYLLRPINFEWQH